MCFWCWAFILLGFSFWDYKCELHIKRESRRRSCSKPILSQQQEPPTKDGSQLSKILPHVKSRKQTSPQTMITVTTKSIGEWVRCLRSAKTYQVSKGLLDGTYHWWKILKNPWEIALSILVDTKSATDYPFLRMSLWLPRQPGVLSVVCIFCCIAVFLFCTLGNRWELSQQESVTSCIPHPCPCFCER